MAGAQRLSLWPSASAEVDEFHLDALARAYRTALLDMLVRDRKARAVGVQ